MTQITVMEMKRESLNPVFSNYQHLSPRLVLVRVGLFATRRWTGANNNNKKKETNWHTTSFDFPFKTIRANCTFDLKEHFLQWDLLSFIFQDIKGFRFPLEPTLIINFIIYVSFDVYLSGIFAYLNYLTPKTRREIIETLIKGLQRLEYRGYDSAGSISSSSKRTSKQFFFYCYFFIKFQESVWTRLCLTA